MNFKEEIQKLANVVITEDCSLTFNQKKNKIWTNAGFSNKNIEERAMEFINYINSEEKLSKIRPFMKWLIIYNRRRAIVELDNKCPSYYEGVYTENEHKRIAINK